MGKIILEFDSFEESIDARTALDASKWKSSIWDLDQELRNTTKYGKGIIDPLKDASEIEIEVAEKIRELIREILTNDGLNLEE
jgi:hypothetical protein